jgi:hypothetical protein
MNDIRPDWIVLLVSLIIGFALRKRQQHIYLRSVPFYLLFALVVELLGRYLRTQSINNVPIFNFFSIIQILYFSYCYYQIVKQDYILKFMLVLPNLCLLNMIFFQGFNSFHTYTFTINVLCIVRFSVHYYYEVFKEAEVESLQKEANFWFVTGVLLYHTSSLSIIGILNYIAELPPELIQLTRKTLLTVNVIFYIILIIAFLCKPNTQKSILKS